MNQLAVPRSESTHQRLYEFARTALVRIFAHPYATVCELFCGGGLDADKWDDAQIGHYMGIGTQFFFLFVFSDFGFWVWFFSFFESENLIIL
jgi:hypothetical protein